MIQNKETEKAPVTDLIYVYIYMLSQSLGDKVLQPICEVATVWDQQTMVYLG